MMTTLLLKSKTPLLSIGGWRCSRTCHRGGKAGEEVMTKIRTRNKNTKPLLIKEQILKKTNFLLLNKMRTLLLYRKQKLNNYPISWQSRTWTSKFKKESSSASSVTSAPANRPFSQPLSATFSTFLILSCSKMRTKQCYKTKNSRKIFTRLQRRNSNHPQSRFLTVSHTFSRYLGFKTRRLEKTSLLVRSLTRKSTRTWSIYVSCQGILRFCHPGTRLRSARKVSI